MRAYPLVVAGLRQQFGIAAAVVRNAGVTQSLVPSAGLRGVRAPDVGQPVTDHPAGNGGPIFAGQSVLASLAG